MAVALLVQIDDDEQAKKWAQYLVDNGIVMNSHGPEGIDVAAATIRGAWKIPTQYCNSADGHLQGQGKTRAGFTRGKKFGWWVCAVCGKPTEDWGKGGNWDYVLGTNLLPQEISDEPRRKGWERSPKQWDFLLESKEDNDGE
jgi:hypothetical protein